MSSNSNNILKNSFESNGKTICNICSVFIPNDASWQAHINGQKHKRNLARQEKWRKLALSSVYVGGIKDLPVAELSIADYFSQFCNIKKITIDKTSKQYAIVELESEAVVQKVLDKKQHHIDGVKVVVKPRIIKSLAAHTHAKHTKQNESDQVFNEVIIQELKEATTVDDQIVLVQERLQLSEDDVYLRNLLCQLLQTALREILPDCEVQQFGSSANGFGIHGCDLDLNLRYFQYQSSIHDVLSRCDESATFDEEVSINKSDILAAVAAVIQQCVPDCHKVKQIPTARLPVVRFYHKASKMRCDLSLSNEIAIRNTEYLNFCTCLCPQFRPLVFIIRTWMKHWELAGGLHTNGPRLNNYAVTLLVLFFLQLENILPSLSQIRSSMKKSEQIIINGCNCSFPSQFNEGSTQRSQSTRNLSTLVSDFFHFYSNLNFTETIIDLFSSTLISLRDFQSKNKIADSHANEDDSVKPKSQFKVTAINVRDPFELDHNVTGNVNEKHLKIFIKRIRNASLACRMQRYHTRCKSNEKEWGILNLFIDHHNKELQANTKTKSDPTNERIYEISIHSSIDNNLWNPQAVGSFVLITLRDVFYVTFPSNDVFSGGVNANIDSSVTCSFLDTNVGSIDNIPLSSDCVLDVNLRKRKASSPEPYDIAKRAKLLIDSPTANHISSVMKRSTLINLPLHCKCEVLHKLWEGRRKARRQLVQKGKSDLFELEKEISKLILSNCNNLTVNSSIVSDCFNASTSSIDSSQEAIFQFDLKLITKDPSSLCITFQPQSHCREFLTFFHHLELFLPNFIAKCSSKYESTTA